MKENPAQNIPDYVKKKSGERLAAGRDPRTVSWHESLESLLFQINDSLVPGEIVTIESLAEKERSKFNQIWVSLDLAPFVTAAFLSPAMTDRLKTDGDTRSSGQASGKSNKILVSRVNDYDRILTAEISSSNPGIDILDDGSLLGCYNYGSAEECISDLSKIIWIHLKHKKTWSQEDYIRYTENWFFRSAVSRISNLPVNANHSYIHHPVLIGLSTVKAVFRLMQATMNRLCGNPDNIIALANDANLYKADTVKISREGLVKGDAAQRNSLRIYVDEKLLSLLKLLKGYDIIGFRNFSEAEQREFKITFSRIVEDTYRMLLSEMEADPPNS